jgi:hypothetical protein
MPKVPIKYSVKIEAIIVMVFFKSKKSKCFSLHNNISEYLLDFILHYCLLHFLPNLIRRYFYRRSFEKCTVFTKWADDYLKRLVLFHILDGIVDLKC